MKITELAEKYGVDKRSIDYWTNLGLIHADGTSKVNGYRIYGETAEKELKKILIVKAMGVESKLTEYVDMLNHLPKEFWKLIVFDRIDVEIERITISYNKAKEYAKEMMES